MLSQKVPKPKDDIDTRGIFPKARCPVLSCKANHGDKGTSCGYLSVRPITPCQHPKHKLEYAERTDTQMEVIE